MRQAWLTALLLLGQPLPAQVGPWSLGLAYQGADFSGRYDHKDGQNVTTYDASRDLGLGKSSLGVGLGLVYEGRLFRFHAATWGQNYSGDRNVVQDVAVDGKLYRAGARVQSRASLRDYELDATFKVLRSAEGYLGVDVGVVDWTIEVSAQGQGSVAGGPVQELAAQAAGRQAIPQVGLSAGYRFGAQVDVRGYYRLLSRSGASYRRAGAEVRYFPLKAVGVRLNLENESFDVPKGSLDADTALAIDKNGAGLGVVWRF